MFCLKYIFLIICLSPYLSSGPQDLDFFDNLQSRQIVEASEVEVAEMPEVVFKDEGVCSDLSLDKKSSSKLEKNSKLNKVVLSVLGGFGVVATALGFIFRDRLFLSPFQRELKYITKMSHFNAVFGKLITPAYQDSNHANFIHEKLKSGDEADILAAVYMMVKDLGLEDEVKFYSDFYKFADDGQETQICNTIGASGQITKGNLDEGQRARLNGKLPQTFKAIKNALNQQDIEGKVSQRVRVVKDAYTVAQSFETSFKEFCNKIEVPDDVKNAVLYRLSRFEHNTANDLAAICGLVRTGKMVCELLKNQFKFDEGSSYQWQYFDQYYKTGSDLGASPQTQDMNKIKGNYRNILNLFYYFVEKLKEASDQVQGFEGLGECAICLGSVMNESGFPHKDDVQCHPRLFHHDCIKKWASKNPRCPYCRAIIKKNIRPAQEA